MKAIYVLIILMILTNCERSSPTETRPNTEKSVMQEFSDSIIYVHEFDLYINDEQITFEEEHEGFIFKFYSSLTSRINADAISKKRYISVLLDSVSVNGIGIITFEPSYYVYMMNKSKQKEITTIAHVVNSENNDVMFCFNNEVASGNSGSSIKDCYVFDEEKDVYVFFGQRE